MVNNNTEQKTQTLLRQLSYGVCLNLVNLAKEYAKIAQIDILPLKVFTNFKLFYISREL